MIEERSTTVIQSVRLSERLGADVVLASETFQWTGSFKFRAASHLARSVPQRSIIAASSGNFGQALAFACQEAGKRCTVVMPASSARVKIEAVRAYGATVDLVDTSVVKREERVAQLAAADPTAYVASAYDDPLVIQGNASLGRELAELRKTYRFDAVVAPIGGGGLSSGILTGFRDAGDRTPVWGVEPAMADDFVQSLAAGHIVAHEREPQTIADGARTRSVGVHNWEILRTGLAGACGVTEDGIREAMRVCFALANLKVEPTGALPVAALLEQPSRFRGQRVCCVVSGGNVDPAVYFHIVNSGW